jgi:hypothetical protein
LFLAPRAAGLPITSISGTTKPTKNTKRFFDRINGIRRITIQIQPFLLAEAKLSEILKIL